MSQEASKETRIKLIRDIVIYSILRQTRNKLERKKISEEKIKELIKITQSKLNVVFDSYNEDFVLGGKVASEKDFENHLNNLIEFSRNRLIEETNNDLKS